MYTREVMAACRRHAWLLAIALVLAVAGGVAAANQVGPRYGMSADIVLLPPRSAVPDGSNPLLAMGDLGQAVDVTVLAATDDVEHARLVRAGATDDFEIVNDRATSAPIIRVITTAPTRAQARATTEVVAKAIPGIVRSVQSDLQRAPEEFITASVLRIQQQADVMRKKQIQLGIGVMALGVFLAVLLVMAVDAWRSARARARMSEVSGVADGDPVLGQPFSDSIRDDPTGERPRTSTLASGSRN